MLDASVLGYQGFWCRDKNVWTDREGLLWHINESQNLCYCECDPEVGNCARVCTIERIILTIHWTSSAAVVRNNVLPLSWVQLTARHFCRLSVPAEEDSPTGNKRLQIAISLGLCHSDRMIDWDPNLLHIFSVAIDSACGSASAFPTLSTSALIPCRIGVNENKNFRETILFILAYARWSAFSFL